MAKENKVYNIRVVKSPKKEFASLPVNKPYTSKSTVEGIPDGKYFLVRYSSNAKLDGDGAVLSSLARISDLVFNNSTSEELFLAIENALTDEKNYTVNADGSISIHPTVIAVKGCYLSRKTKKPFTMIGADGKELKNTDKTPRTNDILRVFVHHDQDEDIQFALAEKAITRRKGWVDITSDGEDDIPAQ